MTKNPWLKKLKLLTRLQKLYLLFVVATFIFFLSFIICFILYMFYNSDFDDDLLLGFPAFFPIIACIMLFKPIMKSTPYKKRRFIIALGLIMSNLYLNFIGFFEPYYMSNDIAIFRPLNLIIFWIPFFICLAFALALLLRIFREQNRSLHLTAVLFIFIASFYPSAIIFFCDFTAFIALFWLSSVLYGLFYFSKKRNILFLSASFITIFISFLVKGDILSSSDIVSFWKTILLILIQFIFILELYILHPYIQKIAKQGIAPAFVEHCPSILTLGRKIKIWLEKAIEKIKVWLKKAVILYQEGYAKKAKRNTTSLLLILGAMALTYLLVSLLLVMLFK